MAKITLTIGGYAHEMACRDGEEDHFLRLAGLLDAKATEAARAVGGLTETRMLLFAGLLLADENAGLRAAAAAAPPPQPVATPSADRESLPDPLLAQAVAALSSRIEVLAAGLEADARTS
ncbi:MAG TPA: cell division protein ZapA [Sphingomonas sp.]|jgi:cell division protein ZapA|uniref:cell division protein ZapA n=1 Tax=Sphingomonas sp. TaxID=28214 RepID=UPI002ED783C8